MSKLYLVALSQHQSNDIAAQTWLLDQVSSRLVYLTEVSHSVRNDTYSDLPPLIQLLVQVYAACPSGYSSSNSFEIETTLKTLLSKYEQNYSSEQVASARQYFDNIDENLWQEIESIETERINDSEDSLDKLPLQYFFWRNHKSR